MSANKKSLWIALIILLTLGIALASTATAGENKGQKRSHAVKKACGEDIKNICGDVERGEGRIKACVQENFEQFSPQCQATIKKAKAKKGKRSQGVKKACGEDIKNVCGDVERGEGRIKACVQENFEQLSPQCQATLKKAKRGKKQGKRQGKQGKRRAAHKAACGDDVQRLCGDVERGEGRLKACMQENADALSDQCATFIEDARGGKKGARRGGKKGARRGGKKGARRGGQGKRGKGHAAR